MAPAFNHRLPTEAVEGAEKIARATAKGALTLPVTAIADPAERAGFWREMRRAMFAIAMEGTGKTPPRPVGGLHRVH